MAVDALNNTLNSTKQGNGYSAMTSADFTKIILSELGRQDPLAPNDTNQLVQQIANIRSIQSDMDLGDRLGKLVSSDEFASAAGLMGKSVSGVSDAIGRIAGTVVGVSRTSSGAVLRLEDGSTLDFAQIDNITEAEDAA